MLQLERVQLPLAIDSFDGKQLRLLLHKRPGFEQEDVLSGQPGGDLPISVLLPLVFTQTRLTPHSPLHLSHRGGHKPERILLPLT